jgi:purine-cytosine permease-like protein
LAHADLITLPQLLSVPRYFLALLITAIYLPIALALSSHFSSYLSKFLYILSYWVALYLPPVIFENLLFRHPMTVGRNGTYDLRAWDDWRRLPLGYAAVGSWVVGVPCTTAGIGKPLHSPPFLL